jgi:hypothetical protein
MSLGSLSRRSLLPLGLTLAATFGALAVGASSSEGSSPGARALSVPQGHSARQPTTLRGAPLGPATGLRLLVADSTPFVLDVDTGSETPVSGIDLPDGSVVSVTGAAGRSAFLVADPMLPGTTGQRYARDWSIYAVRSGTATASLVGTGSYDASPQASGLGIWVRQVVSRSHCRLERIALDGKMSARHAIPCNWTLAPAGSLGLVAGRTRVIDPRTGRTTLRTRNGVLAAVGRRLLTAGPGYAHAPGFKFRLLDVATGSGRAVRWPSIVGQLDEPATDPQGRYIALGFGDPAWDGGGEQVLDVWVLDAQTGALTHVPGMPAFVHLKFTSMDWTGDGRLVLLGQDDEHGFVAVWRPGQAQLAIKPVELPQRTGGSDAFAILA